MAGKSVWLSLQYQLQIETIALERIIYGSQTLAFLSLTDLQSPTSEFSF